MKKDPYLTYFGHPVLPCGFNDDPIAWFEVDSPGNNWRVWPTLVDTFIGFEVMVITKEMMDVFINACPDFSPDYLNNLWTIPQEYTVHMTQTHGWPDLMIAAANNVVSITRDKRTQNIPGEWSDSDVRPVNEELDMLGVTPTLPMRKRA